MNRRLVWLRIVIGLAGVLGTAAVLDCAVAQTTLYSDSFSGAGGALNGTLLQGGTLQGGTVAWSTNSPFRNNGTIDGSAEGSAILPFTPIVNATYTLSMDVANTTDRWVGLGFKNSALGAPGTSTANDRFSNGGGIAWMLYRDHLTDPTQDIQIFEGPNTTAQIPDNDIAFNSAATNQLRIVLDTTGDGSTFTANFLLNGSSVTSTGLPVTINQPISAIQYVGLTFDNATTNTGITFDNFLLTGPGTNQWNVNGGGSFGNGANWSLGVPTAGAIVQFGDILTAPNSPATVTLNAPATLGEVQFNNAGASYILAGPSTLTLNGARSVDVMAGQHEISAVVAGAVGLAKEGPGVLTLSANNTYTGQTNVTEGVLQFNAAGRPGASDGTAANGTVLGGNQSTGRIALSGGAAVGPEVLVLGARELAALNSPHLTSAGNNSWAGNLKGEVGGSNYNIVSDSGTLALGGTISAPDSGTRNFVFDGAGNVNVTGRITDLATDADGNASVPLVNNVSSVNVIKRGGGALTIGTATNNNDDYWLGATTIEGGTLEVISDGASNGELKSTTIDVRAGATLDVDHFSTYALQPGQTLSGGGTVRATGKSVDVYDDNHLTPGDGVGTLTINGTVNVRADIGGGSLNYQLGDATAIGGSENDLIQINGGLSTSGAPTMTLNVSPVEADLASGTYRLISHSGGATNFSGVTPRVVNRNGDVLNPRQTLAVSGTTAGQVNLIVTGSEASLTWNGSAGNNVWDVNASTNWTGADGRFRDLDDVTFGAGGVKNVAVNSNVAPGVVNFNGGAGSTYTLTGSGGITGYGGVNVNSGAAKLLNAGNNYGGATTVASGARLEVASPTTGSVTVNGVLAVKNNLVTNFTDSFTGNLSAYANTRLLKVTAAAPNNVYSWEVANDSVQINTTTYGDIEQYALTRTDATLEIGEELRVEYSPDNLNPQDIGLYVGAGAPTPDVRQNYVSVYARNNGQVLSRGFDGTTEFGLVGGVTPTNIDSLFVARTGTDTFETGYYENGTRNVLTTRTITGGNAAGIGNAIGLYADVRGAGIRGNVDNLTISTGSASNVLTVEGDLNLAAGGQLEFDISDFGFTSADVTGSATLAGTIAVNLLDGFMPTEGTDYSLLSAVGGINAAGVTFSLPSLSGGLAWDTSDFATSGLLSVIAAGLAGDFDSDGDVDGADFLAWQRNPSVGSLDDWKANFGTASQTSVAGAVPEPSSLALVLGGLGGMLGCRSLSRQRTLGRA